MDKKKLSWVAIKTSLKPGVSIQHLMGDIRNEEMLGSLKATYFFLAQEPNSREEAVDEIIGHVVSHHLSIPAFLALAVMDFQIEWDVMPSMHELIKHREAIRHHHSELTNALDLASRMLDHISRDIESAPLEIEGENELQPPDSVN